MPFSASPTPRASIFRLLRLAPAALLSLCAVQAAAVELEVLDLDQAHNTVSIAILGGPEFDTSTVTKRSLVFGWSRQGRDGGYVPAKRLRTLRDVNGDGHRDRIAVFKLSEPDFQALFEGEVVRVELRGVWRDDLFHREFVAQTNVVGDSDPISACAKVENQEGALVGERCLWPIADGSAYKPIVVDQLVDDLNQGLANAGLEIAPGSAVVIEAYGGEGYAGGKSGGGDSCTAKGGDGGAAGYARTIVSVADLPSDLLIYPGNGATEIRQGGAGTVVSSVNLADLSATQLNATAPADLESAGIVAIAGGGGGGGSGNISSTDCHHGGDGGAGGSAIADPSGLVVVAGADGTRGDPGGGGGQDGAGTGGSGSPIGSNGIGGPGGAGAAKSNSGVGGGPLWDGWSSADNPLYTTDEWVFGAGAYPSDNAGAGGGGFGGGGAAKGGGSAHNGGGGGAGSFAVRAAIASSDIAADLIYGPPDQSEASSLVVVTFEVQAVSE